MTFTDMQNFSMPPARISEPPFGNVLKAFPPKDLDPHSQLGYSFRIEPCNAVTGYDPDVCVDPAENKMAPDEYGSEGNAELRVIQAAFKCSTIGATDQELRDHARGAIERNLWRDVDETLVDMLAAEADAQGGGFSAECLLAEAAQYLATNSFSGTGVIYGSAAFVTMLPEGSITKVGNAFQDRLGNIIVPSSVDSATVFAFDSEVEIRASEIQLLDGYAPGIRQVNDRVSRAELIYTVAVDNCAIGSFTLTACS